MLAFLRLEVRWVGAGLLLTAFSGFGQTYFISLFNASLRSAFELSHGRIGLLYAAATLTSAFVLLEFGKIVDRRSTRTSALVATYGLAAACLMLALAPVWWALLPAFFGLRLFGQGLMSHVAMTATGRWFNAERGRAVSLVSLGYPLSEMALPAVTVLALSLLGWRETWVVAAIVLACLCAPAFWILLSSERAPAAARIAPGESPAPGKRQWRRSEVLSEPSFWLMLLGILAPAFMVTGLFFHHQNMLDVKGWPVGAFAFGFSLFALVSMAASLVAGALVDRFGARPLLPFYLLPMAVALFLPITFSGVWVVLALMALLGVMAGAAATLMGAIWPELYGVEHLGEIRALSFAAMVASSAASPFLIGVLIDLGVAITVQLAVMGGYALLASALMGLIQPRLAEIAADHATPQPAE